MELNIIPELISLCLIGFINLLVEVICIGGVHKLRSQMRGFAKCLLDCIIVYNCIIWIYCSKMSIMHTYVGSVRTNNFNEKLEIFHLVKKFEFFILKLIMKFFFHSFGFLFRCSSCFFDSFMNLIKSMVYWNSRWINI